MTPDRSRVTPEPSATGSTLPPIPSFGPRFDAAVRGRSELLPDMDALDLDRRSRTVNIIAVSEIVAATPQALLLSFVDLRPTAIIAGLLIGWALAIAPNVRGHRLLARILVLGVSLMGYVALGFLLGTASGFHTIAFIFPPMVLLLVPLRERLFFWTGLLLPGVLYFLVTLGGPIEPVDLGPLAEVTYVSMSLSAFAVIASLLYAAARMSRTPVEVLSGVVQLVARERDARRRADEAKSLFLANMSHELRTPLNAIIGYSQLLREELEADEQAHLDIERIHLSGTHLLSLVNDVLDLSKIEARKLELRWSTIELDAMFGEVHDMLEGLAEKRANRLHVHVDPEARELRSDHDKLKQILVNLAGNAIKFTEAGEVELIATRSDEDVVIEVRDTGIGMREADLERVFEAFEQADKSTTRTFGGTGLGLTLCRELTALLGGELSVRSVLGVGSTFRLVLPRSPVTA